MSDRTHLYYGVPVDVLGLPRRYSGTRYRFVQRVGAVNALVVVYPTRRRYEYAIVNVEHLRISQVPSEPPPMPEELEARIT